MSWTTFIVALALAQAEEGSLNPKQRTEVQAAGVAFQQGEPLVVLQRLAPLAAKEDLLPALDDELKRQKLPPLADLLAQARLAALRQDQATAAPRPSRHETLLLLPGLKRHLEAMLDDVVGLPVMRDELPAPDSLAGFRNVFVQLNAVEGQVDDMEQTGTYLRTLARGVAKPDLEKLPEDLRAMVGQDDAGGLVASLEAMRGGLEERRIEMSIERLKLLVKVLGQPQMTPEHLQAAALWTGDHQRAVAFLKKTRMPRRPALKEKDLLKQITALAEQARKSAGGLTARARLLHEGLEWWLRGRYGAGPQAAGLVKSPDQMRTPEGRYQLYMPSITPQPTDPFAKPQSAQPFPPYQRRHLYVWAWGNRHLHLQGCWNPAREKKEEKAEPRRAFDPGSAGYHRAKFLVSSTAGDEKAAFVSRTAFERENDNLLRVVGFLEYAQALSRFDQLLRTATPAELSAMDELVKEQDQFVLHINLSREFPQTGTTAFPERPRPNDTFQRSGLPWVIALTRVELGAMLAAFSPNPESFQRVPPSTYETAAYEELLIDAMRMHLWGLQNDPLFQERNLREAAQRNGEIGPLYERRVRLALRLLATVREWLGQRLTAFQREELRQYELRFSEYQAFIRREIPRLSDEAPRKGTSVKGKN